MKNALYGLEWMCVYAHVYVPNVLCVFVWI